MASIATGLLLTAATLKAQPEAGALLVRSTLMHYETSSAKGRATPASASRDAFDSPERKEVWVGTDAAAWDVDGGGKHGASQPGRVPRKNRGSGSHFDGKTLRVKHGGDIRTASVLMPKGIDDGEKYPLIINFHGIGGNPKVMSDRYPSLVERERVIAVFPRGKHNGDRQWWMRRGVPDIEFANKLIDGALAMLPVDKDDVYVIGYSQGASFAWAVGCKLSHRLSGLGIISAGPNRTMVAESRCAKWGFPVFYTHGDKDTSKPFKGRGDMMGAWDGVEFARSQNSCGRGTEVTKWPNRAKDDGTRVVQHDLDGCPGGAPVRFLKVVGGGHAIPDTDLKGRGKCAEFNAFEEAWTVFKAGTIPVGARQGTLSSGGDQAAKTQAACESRESEPPTSVESVRVRSE